MLQVAQIVEDLAFKINFRQRAFILFADFIQLFNNITKVAVDFVDFFKALRVLNGFALARVFKLHAFGKKLTFIFAKIDFQNVIVRFLTKGIAINIFRMRNSQTFSIVIHVRHLFRVYSVLFSPDAAKDKLHG